MRDSLIKEYKELLQLNAPSPTKSPVLVFTSNWIKANKLKFSSDLFYVFSDYTNTALPLHVLEADYYNYYGKLEELYSSLTREEKATVPRLPKELTRRKLAVTFNQLEKQGGLKVKKEQLEALAYDTEAEFNWGDLASLFSEDSSALDVTVLQHFFWNVKRKMAGLTAENHLFLLLTSAQHGTGKTRLLAKICDVIPHFSVTTSFKAINDKREYQLFVDNYLCIVDEMAGSDKVSSNTLREFLTQDTFSQRTMGTTKNTTFKNNASFIATSNKRLHSLIHDTTGMRRYYEFVVVDNLDWELVNRLDYLAMFKTINEQEASPLDKYALAVLRSVQAEYIASTKEEDFLEALGLPKRCPQEFLSDEFLLQKGVGFFGIRELYKSFKEWAEEVGIAQVASQKLFKSNLEDRGYVVPKDPRRVGTGLVRGIALPFLDIEKQLNRASGIVALKLVKDNTNPQENDND